MDRNLAKISLPLMAVSVAMLMYAMYGSPPYVYFGALKWVVAATCGLTAWAVYKASAGWAVLSVLLAVSGGIEVFASMRREDWYWFNGATTILLAVSSVIVAAVFFKKRDTA